MNDERRSKRFTIEFVFLAFRQALVLANGFFEPQRGQSKLFARGYTFGLLYTAFALLVGWVISDSGAIGGLEFLNSSYVFGERIWRAIVTFVCLAWIVAIVAQHDSIKSAVTHWLNSNRTGDRTRAGQIFVSWLPKPAFAVAVAVPYILGFVIIGQLDLVITKGEPDLVDLMILSGLIMALAFLGWPIAFFACASFLYAMANSFGVTGSDILTMFVILAAIFSLSFFNPPTSAALAVILAALTMNYIERAPVYVFVLLAPAIIAGFYTFYMRWHDPFLYREETLARRRRTDLLLIPAFAALSYATFVIWGLIASSDGSFDLNRYLRDIWTNGDWAHGIALYLFFLVPAIPIVLRWLVNQREPLAARVRSRILTYASIGGWFLLGLVMLFFLAIWEILKWLSRNPLHGWAKHARSQRRVTIEFCVIAALPLFFLFVLYPTFGEPVGIYGDDDATHYERFALPQGYDAERRRAHRSAVTDIAFNADGSVFATAGLDKKVRFWETERKVQFHEIWDDHINRGESKRRDEVTAFWAVRSIRFAELPGIDGESLVINSTATIADTNLDGEVSLPDTQFDLGGGAGSPDGWSLAATQIEGSAVSNDATVGNEFELYVNALHLVSNHELNIGTPQSYLTATTSQRYYLREFGTVDQISIGTTPRSKDVSHDTSGLTMSLFDVSEDDLTMVIITSEGHGLIYRRQSIEDEFVFDRPLAPAAPNEDDAPVAEPDLSPQLSIERIVVPGGTSLAEVFDSNGNVYLRDLETEGVWVSFDQGANFELLNTPLMASLGPEFDNEVWGSDLNGALFRITPKGAEATGVSAPDAFSRPVIAQTASGSAAYALDRTGRVIYGFGDPGALQEVPSEVATAPSILRFFGPLEPGNDEIGFVVPTTTLEPEAVVVMYLMSTATKGAPRLTRSNITFPTPRVLGAYTWIGGTRYAMGFDGALGIVDAGPLARQPSTALSLTDIDTGEFNILDLTYDPVSGFLAALTENGDVRTYHPTEDGGFAFLGLISISDAARPTRTTGLDRLTGVDFAEDHLFLVSDNALYRVAILDLLFNLPSQTNVTDRGQPVCANCIIAEFVGTGVGRDALSYTGADTENPDAPPRTADFVTIDGNGIVLRYDTGEAVPSELDQGYTLNGSPVFAEYLGEDTYGIAFDNKTVRLIQPVSDTAKDTPAVADEFRSMPTALAAHLEKSRLVVGMASGDVRMIRLDDHEKRKTRDFLYRLFHPTDDQ